MKSSRNWFEFINKFFKIHQWIHLNSSANSIEYINHLKCLQIFKKYHSFLLFGFFEKIINEFTNEFIELNLSLSFLNFSHFAKLFIKFFKSKSLPWISNCYCHSRNEFTDEFIDLNLINVCDIHTDRQTDRQTYIVASWVSRSSRSRD